MATEIEPRGSAPLTTVSDGDPAMNAGTAGGSGASGPAAARPPLDPLALRADFPILDQVVHGHPLVYLDSAATSQKPRLVIDTVDSYYREYNANVHRGIYEIGERATAAYEAARASVARFIGVPDPHEIVFTRNATEAINLVAYSWGRRNIGRGDMIVLTEMEHHANLVPWQLLAQEVDGDLEFIPITDDGLLRMDVFEVLLRLKPKLVAFAHVSNTLGTINPVEELTRRAHEAGALVLVDGAQAVPHVPVDVSAIGCDFYAFSGHKMLAPTGSGVLWGRRELLEAMPPFLAGGEMIREVHLRRSEWNDVPWKFEAGTPDISAAVGLGAAADYLSALGMDRVAAHERELVAYALEMLPREVPGIEIYGPSAEHRGGVVSFNLPGIHPHDVAQVLDRFGIAVRAGHHCTMPLHERLDLAATARVSFGVHTTKADLDALATGLREVVRLFQGEPPLS
jgi:cysteine desulfurase / selenocysteine lyase